MRRPIPSRALPAPGREPRRGASPPLLQLVATAALLVSLAVALTAVSFGIARARAAVPPVTAIMH